MNNSYLDFRKGKTFNDYYYNTHPNNYLKNDIANQQYSLCFYNFTND